MKKTCLLYQLIWFFFSCHTPITEAGPNHAGSMQFIKGQTHLHSNHSGDSETPPEEVARWYASHGYDFIVFTDHNYVTHLESNDVLVIPGVELTQNFRTCVPAPPPGLLCLLHINALFTKIPDPKHIQWPDIESKQRIDIFTRALTMTESLEGIAQLNHANFHYAADANLIFRLAQKGLILFEIANKSYDANNEGDGTHPSTEALWDAVLSKGVTLYGVATDDAHHYKDTESMQAKGNPVFPGDLGFIMVQSPKDVSQIQEAIKNGKFYSSTGVLLERIEVTDKTLSIWIDTTPGRTYEITLIGKNGKTLATRKGSSIKFSLSKVKNSYVRARIRNDLGQFAWTQPVRAF